MPDCRSCFNCRIVNKNTRLKCKIGFWLDQDGNEKRVKLKPHEIIRIRTNGNSIEIDFRKLFDQAKKCLFYPE